MTRSIDRSCLGWVLLLVLTTIPVACVNDQAAAQSPDTALHRAWRQELENARFGEDGVWLGYGLKLPLDPNTLLIQGIPMSWNHGAIEFRGVYIRDLIAGNGQNKGQLSIAPGEVAGDKVLRDVAILLGYNPERELDRVLLLNQDLPVDLGEREFQWLGASRPEECVALMRTLFQATRKSRIRQRVLAAVGWHQMPSAEALLRQALEQDPEQSIRLEAVRGFRHFLDASTARLMDSLARSSENPKLRAEAVGILGRIPDSTATSALLALLDPEDDVNVQSRLIRSLASRSEAQAQEAVLRIVDSEGPDKLRREAILALTRYQEDERMRSRLEAWAMGSEAIIVRRTAVEQLGRKFLPTARAALLRVIQSEPENKVVAQAINSLRRLPAPEATSTLSQLAARDERAMVRLEAVKGLAKLGSSDQAALLERIAFTDSDKKVQKGAVEALRKTPGEESREGLIRIAETHSLPDIRRVAVREMARRASDLVAQKVGGIARRDPDRGVQSEAIAALRKIGLDQAIQSLAQIARDHPVYEMRRRAIQELGRSESPIARAALLEMIEKN